MRHRNEVFMYGRAVTVNGHSPAFLGCFPRPAPLPSAAPGFAEGAEMSMSPAGIAATVGRRPSGACDGIGVLFAGLFLMRILQIAVKRGIIEVLLFIIERRLFPMRIKRILFIGLVCIMTINLLTVSASAHGGCHGRSTKAQQTVISVCTIEDCSLPGSHVHNGVIYCGYDHEGGYCQGTCLALCPVEGCTVAGRHVHNNVTYCGNDHSCGFCDGTCSVRSCWGWHH